MADIMVTHCTRETLMEAVRLKNKGLTTRNIAKRIGYHHTQMGRYLRLYRLYGPEVFIEQKTL